jgi:hypothetical protein
MNKQVCCGEAAVFGKGFFHLTVVLARFRELSAKRNPNAFDALDDAGSDHGACSPLLSVGQQLLDRLSESAFITQPTRSTNCSGYW